MHRAIVATLDIILPCPDQLDRGAAKTLGYGRGFTLHMGVGHGASAKAPTGHLGMEGDLLRLQAQDFRNSRLVNRLELRPGPGFCAVAIEADRRV